MYNKVKSDKEIIAIRKSGEMLAQVLASVCDMAKPGVTGIELDAHAQTMLKDLGGVPAFLGYQGFPNAICISVNDAVVHGIPNDVPLKDGDIVGFDFGVTYDGMITDAARTVIVGTGTPEVEQLVKTTLRSLDEAINTVKNGVSVGTISAAAQDVMEQHNYGVVRDLVGHGVGHHVHEEPEIPNYGHKGTGPTLKAGMTVAIEPMATMGDWKVVVDPDGWTIRTRDGSLAAHFEDTILVTDDGAEILTR